MNICRIVKLILHSFLMFLFKLSILSCSCHYRQELYRIAYVRSALSLRTSTYHERCLSQLALQKNILLCRNLTRVSFQSKNLMVLYPSIISILSPSSILSCHYMSLFYTLIILWRKLNITSSRNHFTSLHCTALHCTALRKMSIEN